MIDYITIGTNDLQKAGEFYDAVFGLLGGRRAREGERMIMWADKTGKDAFSVIKPFDKKSASAGNGTMVVLGAGNAETVKAVHAKALAMGGTDEGAPGPRGTTGFYGGYFRDLDGNKLVAYFRQPVK